MKIIHGMEKRLDTTPRLARLIASYTPVTSLYNMYTIYTIICFSLVAKKTKPFRKKNDSFLFAEYIKLDFFFSTRDSIHNHGRAGCENIRFRLDIPQF